MPNYQRAKIFLKYRKFYGVIMMLLLGHEMLALANIYKTIDSSGNSHFSDLPTANSNLVELKPVNRYSPEKTAPSDENSRVVIGEKKHYQFLSISTPKDQQAFQNQREIAVDVVLQPSLQSGDKLEFIVDGVVFTQTQSNSIMLNNIDRGKHNLQVRVVDAANQIVITSNAVRFYVHYVTIAG